MEITHFSFLYNTDPTSLHAILLGNFFFAVPFLWCCPVPKYPFLGTWALLTLSLKQTSPLCGWLQFWLRSKGFLLFHPPSMAASEIDSLPKLGVFLFDSVEIVLKLSFKFILEFFYYWDQKILRGNTRISVNLWFLCQDLLTCWSHASSTKHPDDESWSIDYTNKASKPWMLFKVLSISTGPHLEHHKVLTVTRFPLIVSTLITQPRGVKSL